MPITTSSTRASRRSAHALVNDALAAASHDIVQGIPDRLSIAQARLLGLGPWCFMAARAGSVYRQQLGHDFADYWQTQQQRAALLAPLLATWHQAGIRAVLIKGMAMAWSVYTHPAMRHCGDIDLLLSPADAAQARRLHIPGWRLMDHPVEQMTAGREAFALVHEQSGCAIDVQQALLPSYGFAPQQVQQITQTILQSARWVAPNHGLGAAARPQLLPQPADLLLILAANRAWTGDAWRHKPHDYMDIRFTIERHGLTPQALLKRADQLGLRATWQGFLVHCNPFRQQFDLVGSRDDKLARLRKELSVFHKGLPTRAHAVLHRARRAPGVLMRALQAAPVLLRVLADLRRYPTPEQACAASVPVQPRRREAQWSTWHVDQAARWAQRLMQPLCNWSSAGPCVVHSLTLYRLLQHHGHAAQWFLGYRANAGDDPAGHAWVECDNPYTFGQGYKNLNARYSPVYKSPPPAAHVVQPHLDTACTKPTLQ